MKNKNIDLLTDPIALTLFKLGAPMVFGIFFILFFILVDVYFIAQLGKSELAAVSFTIPVISFIDALILGFGVATTVVVSRRLGEAEEDQAKKIGLHAIFLCLIVVTIIAGIGMMTIDPLFKMIRAMPDLMPLIKSYMVLSYLGLISLVPPLIGNSVIRGSGNTILPALAMLIAAIVNAILDPILIFGLFGAPRLGMDGAAIATIIARLFGFSFVFFNLIFRFQIFSVWKSLATGFIDSAREILHTALPAATANVTPPVTALVLTGLIAHYGSEAVAAYGVATRVELLFYVPFFGASAALAPFVGQNFGAKNMTRIREAVKIISFFNVLWGASVTIILLLFGRGLASLFSKDPATIQGAMQYFMIVPVSYCAVGLIQVTASYLNAVGKPRQAATIPIVQFLCLILPLSYLGDRFYGLSAVFFAVCFANFAAGLIFYIRMRRNL